MHQKTICWGLISLINNLLLVNLVLGECIEDTVYKEYTDCEHRIKEQYQNITSCTIITHIIDECPDILRSCKSDAEIQDIHADLIKENIAQNISLEDCEVVKKYRSEGWLGTSVPANCTKEMDQKLRGDFNTCSSEVAANVTIILNNTDQLSRNFTKVTCDTLTTLSENCKGILDECITEIDKNALFEEQLRNITTHLQSLMNTTEVMPPLNSCNTTQTTSVNVADDIANIYSSTKKIVKALSENEKSNPHQILFGSSSGAQERISSVEMNLIVILFFTVIYSWII